MALIQPNHMNLNKQRIIILGIISGWFVYFLTVLIAQSVLENRIKSVKIFPRLFANDPAIAASVSHSIKTSNFTNTKYADYKGFNVMTWRILQNLEVISEQDRPDQMSTFINNSLGTIIQSSSLIELQEMSGLDLVYEIQAKTAKEPNNGSQKDQTLDFVGASMAGSPMAYREYVHFVGQSAHLRAFLRKFLAYVIPPEITKGYWYAGSLNDILALSYKHIGVGEEFGQIEERDGKLEKITAYNQYNDLLLKLLIMVYNDESVVNARDRLMVFKGLVQCLILMTFFVTLYVVLFIDFTTKENDRLLDLLKTMLPTLGFIGTILGLMRSLGDAYKIPIASGNANTSLAISEITTSLSIAFTTTLLAFVLLIIVDIIRVYKLKFLGNV